MLLKIATMQLRGTVRFVMAEEGTEKERKIRGEVSCGGNESTHSIAMPPLRKELQLKPGISLSVF